MAVSASAATRDVRHGERYIANTMRPPTALRATQTPTYVSKAVLRLQQCQHATPRCHNGICRWRPHTSAAHNPFGARPRLRGAHRQPWRMLRTGRPAERIRMARRHRIIPRDTRLGNQHLLQPHQQGHIRDHLRRLRQQCRHIHQRYRFAAMPICTGSHKPLRWNITDRQITLRVKPSERRHFYAARHT